jgi:uncharacterized RDD family membrane protein YckC
MLQSASMIYCPKCGQANEPIAQFCQSCGNDLSFTKQAVTTGYAGFWKRVAAAILDSIIVGAISGILTAVTVGLGAMSLLFLPWLYEAIMQSSEKQATFGKMMLGIVVTDVAGGRITFARATGRHFAKWVSAVIMGIGFIMAAFTERKQALHDMIADTLVVNRS